MKRSALVCVALGLLLAGQAHADTSPAPESEVWVEEDELLDLGILPFDPGSDKKKYLLTGYDLINPQLRESEATFIAIHLMRTLQRTREFGLVRMMPRNAVSADLYVTGRIRVSSGRRLELELKVVDATGRRWFKKVYKQKADLYSYAYDDHGQFEPFQRVYDAFAEDLIEARRQQKSDSLEKIRRTAELRFAAQLAPGVFGDYLGVDHRNRIVLERLPARDDPMLVRVRDIQTRDEFFLDLLAERYEGFYASMDKNYDDFRATRFDVELALRDARAQAALARVALLFNPQGTYHQNQYNSKQLDFRRRQATAQYEYLEELASTFASEVEPLKLELDGEVVRFEGTIEEQYRQWQRLLEKIFEAETGFSATAAAAVGQAGLDRQALPSHIP